MVAARADVTRPRGFFRKIIKKMLHGEAPPHSNNKVIKYWKYVHKTKLTEYFFVIIITNRHFPLVFERKIAYNIQYAVRPGWDVVYGGAITLRKPNRGTSTVRMPLFLLNFS